MKTVFTGVLFALVAMAADPTADEILKKAVSNVYSKSEESVYLMKLVTVDGKESERKMRIWFKREGDERAKLLIKFLEPADIRGTGLLNIIEKGKPGDQWMYIPAIKKVRRIKGGNQDESFLGSDFTTGDMNVENKDSFEYKVTGSKKCGDKDCFVLTGQPKASGSGSAYSKKIVEVRKDNYVAVHTEFFNPEGQLEKILTVGAIHQDGSSGWIADKMEMKNVLTNHKTLIEIQKRDTSKAPADSLFTQSNLER